MDMKMTAKIILIVGIALVGISQILPWSGYSVSTMGINVGFDFYSWGVHGYMDISSEMAEMMGDASQATDQWMTYYQMADFTSLGAESGLSIPESAIIGIILLCFLLPLSIIALVLGVLALRNLNRKKSHMSLAAGIVAIVAVILLVVVLLVFGTYSQGAGTETSIPLNWSFGFFLMIVSAALLFVVYAIQLKLPFPAGAVMYQQATPQSSVQPPPQGPPMPQQPPQQDRYEQAKQIMETRSQGTMKLSFCPECGAKLESDQHFCPECGYKIV